MNIEKMPVSDRVVRNRRLIFCKIQPANPIYAEVIARTLSYNAQEKFMLETPSSTIPRYLHDGKIDMDYLMQG